MILHLGKTLLKKCIGNNIVLRRALRNEFEKGNRVKTAFMALCMIPLRKAEFYFEAPRDYYTELHKLLHLSRVEGFELVRMGRDYDGGYIMLNDLQPGNIAYSFGISTDVSWDKAMASKGYDVFMYDHTIEGLPEDNERFHFFRQGISDGTTQDDRLKTLEELIAVNHHENEHDMILKMDVEGAEWGFLENVRTETLMQFSQILFEFHGVNSREIYPRVPEVLRKLNKTHQLVHIHGQNIGQYTSLGAKVFCNQIEVSYVLRDKYNFADKYDVRLPLSIDMPARSNIPEVMLGYWNDDIKPEDKITSITYIFF